MKTTITNKDNLLLPHIGTMLKAYFRKHRTRKAVLARLMSKKKASISNYQKRDTLQIAILWNLCIHLQHNFFADLAAQLPTEFSSNVLIDSSKDEEIARLSEENKLLKTQVETLEKVIHKK